MHNLVKPTDLSIRTRGAMVVNEAFLEPLRRAGLDRVEALLAYRGGELVWKRGEERIIERITLETAAGPVTCYLKRHEPMSWRESLTDLARLRGPVTPGRREWESILRFRAAGLPTMVPVAAGESGDGLRRGRSFSLTLEVEEALPLDRFIRDRLMEDRLDGGVPVPFKRRLIAQVADLARRMHAAGFSHRDFYLCHIFIRPRGDRDPSLSVIDLQRVGRPHRVTRHRRVKDLSALDFSAPASVVTRTDRLRFLLAYLGRSRLDGRARRIAAAVTRKSRRIARHHEKTVRHRERAWIEASRDLESGAPRPSGPRVAGPLEGGTERP